MLPHSAFNPSSSRPASPGPRPIGFCCRVRIGAGASLEKALPADARTDTAPCSDARGAERRSAEAEPGLLPKNSAWVRTRALDARVIESSN